MFSNMEAPSRRQLLSICNVISFHLNSPIDQLLLEWTVHILITLLPATNGQLPEAILEDGHKFSNRDMEPLSPLLESGWVCEMMFVWPPRPGKKSLCPGLWKVMLLPPLLWGSSVSKPHYHTVRSWGNMQLLGPWVIPVQAPVLVSWGGHLLAWGKRNSFSDSSEICQKSETPVLMGVAPFWGLWGIIWPVLPSKFLVVVTHTFHSWVVDPTLQSLPLSSHSLLPCVSPLNFPSAFFYEDTGYWL